MLDGLSLIFEMFSAIGTVGAVVVALWLAYYKTQPQLDCAFIWASATLYRPVLIINNTGRKITIIETIQLMLDGRQIGCFDVLKDQNLCKLAIARPNSEIKMPLNSDEIILNNIDKDRHSEKLDLEVIVYTTNGKKYISKYKYSYEEITDMFFPEGLFDC